MQRRTKLTSFLATACFAFGCGDDSGTGSASATTFGDASESASVTAGDATATASGTADGGSADTGTGDASGTGQDTTAEASDSGTGADTTASASDSSTAGDSSDGGTTGADTGTDGSTSAASDTGSSSSAGTTVGTSVGTTVGSTSDTGTDTTGASGTTGGGEVCVCVPGLDDGIFVLSDNSDIYKYFPATNMFSYVGTFACAGLSDTFSMAVDRNGIAWVMFGTSQDIRHVDLTQVGLPCTDPGYTPNQTDGIHGPFARYGMAFVSNSPNDRCDKLYGNTFDGSSFNEGPIGEGEFIVTDPDTLLTTWIGDTTFNGAELSGSGTGRAFMFGGVGPAKLVEVDKSDGSYISTTNLGNLDLTFAFAFAFFKGDFYFFTESGGFGSNSKVTHLDFDGGGALMDLAGTAPIRIVGAGVSTCVPPA